jgi:hypothetical protein
LSLLAATVLPLLTVLALLAFLALLTLTLLSSLALLTGLRLLTLLIALLLTVAVATRVFIETPSQRIKIVSQLPRAIEILFRTRTVRAARALFCRLQTFRKIIQAAFNCAFIGTTTALLTVLLALLTLLTGGLPAILLATLSLLTGLLPIERLFTFANPLSNAIASESFRRVLQLSRRALLSLPLPLAHRARRRFDVLLQTADRISQRVFSFRQLLASLARVLILRALPATPRETLHIFRDLTLT